MPSSTAPILITEQQLGQHIKRASAFLEKVRWAQPPILSRERKQVIVGKDSSLTFHMPSSAGQAQSVLEASILGIARKVSGDDILLTDEIHQTLIMLRRGLALSFEILALYAKACGLDVLTQRNQRPNALSTEEQTEFRVKQVTSSAITLFTFAAYVHWNLSRYKSEEVRNINMDFEGIPEFVLKNPIESLNCLLYYYAGYLDQPGLIDTGLAFVKLTLCYVQGIIDEIKLREGSLQYHEPFTQNTYKLEHTDFLINGFEVPRNGTQTSIEFRRVRFEDIVGNKDAKHKAQRLAERLICYDPLVKKNVFLELGGMTTLHMGRGKPGTGKSMQIAATATLIAQYCEMLGLPFLFWPLPDTIVSTFQGGSAQNMADWFQPLRDPSKIIYATIDDAENNLQERTRQGASEGERGLIGVFLRNTEGAYSINYGNWVMQLFTNIPDQVDKAVFSRVQDRLDINGAESWEDILDQDYRWWTKYLKIDPHFVNMTDPKGYNYMDAQKRVRNLSEAYHHLGGPTEEKIREIYERVCKVYKVTDHGFFAEFCFQVQQAYPFFSSRDLRNIQSAVDNRIMDFDLPSEWLREPTLFYKKEYDKKKNMIIELMKSNMKGLSFAQIRLQETIHYVETAIRIMATGKERRIEELVEQMVIHHEAQQRIARMNHFNNLS